MRRLAFASLLAFALVGPGRVEACYPCWCPPLPMCCWVYDAAPPVVMMQPAQHAPQMMPSNAVSPSPKVQLTKPRPLTTETIPPAKAAAPVKDPVRPATFDADAPPSKPVLPTPKVVVPPAPPAPMPETIPPLKLTPETPKVEAPTLPGLLPPKSPEVPAPKLELPLSPAPKLDIPPPAPKLELPLSPAPKLDIPAPAPKLDIPPPAPKLELPPPMSLSEPLTLPQVPKAPKEKSPPPLPELVLPPAVPTPAPAPVEPAQFLPQESKSSDTGLPPLVLPSVSLPKVTVQASPLAGVRTALPRVRQIPVAAATKSASAGKCKVGFFNYTQGPLELVIEGEKVTLPRRSYLQAEVPAAFAWQIGTGEVKHVRIPADQAGIELVIE